MGYISAIKIEHVNIDKIDLLFYQFQNCLDISDYDCIDSKALKQQSLTFLYEVIKDYFDSFNHSEKDLPLYVELNNNLMTDDYCLPNIELTNKLITAVEVHAFIDFDSHSDDSFDGTELECAFLSETIEKMPHLLFEIQLADIIWTKGIHKGMYAYSGLDIFSHKWLKTV